MLNTGIEQSVWSKVSKDLSNLTQIKEELKRKQENIKEKIENLEKQDFGESLLKDDVIIIQKKENEITEIPIEIFHKYQEVSKIEEIEKYLQIYSQIVNKNCLHQKCIETRNIEKSIEIILEMKELFSEIKDLTLKWSEIDHFISKIFENCIAKTWKLSATKLDDVITQLEWPFHRETSFKIEHSKPIHLALAYSYLTHLHSIAKSINSRDLPSPMHLLMKNLETRFIYHFNGKKESNSLEKPEWCFEQVLKWMEINLKFIETNLTDAVKEKFEVNYRNVSRDFISEMVKWVVKKVKEGLNEIEELPFADGVKIFSHWVDEIIEFEENLREMGFSPVRGEGESVLELLENERTIPKMLEIEQNTGESIQRRFGVCLDSFEVDWGFDLFVEVKAMQRRAELIDHPNYKLQTIGLIQNILCEMLDQVKNKFKKRGITMDQIIILLNGITFCGENIHKMQDELFFLKIASNSQQCILFDDVISNINCFQTQIIESIQIYATNLILKSANEYAGLEWIQKLPPKDDVTTFDIPRCLGHLLGIINSVMECIADVNTNIRTHICLHVSDQLDKFLFENIFLEKFPNSNLYPVIYFHLQKNLLPLYSKFANVDTIFPRISDVNSLFTRSEVELSLILRDVNTLSDWTAKSSPNKRRVDINTKYSIKYLDSEDVKYLVTQRMNQLSNISD